MDMHHDRKRFRPRLMKDRFEDRDDELLCGVVVVVQEHAPHRRWRQPLICSVFGEDRLTLRGHASIVLVRSRQSMVVGEECAIDDWRSADRSGQQTRFRTPEKRRSAYRLLAKRAGTPIPTRAGMIEFAFLRPREHELHAVA